MRLELTAHALTWATCAALLSVTLAPLPRITTPSRTIPALPAEILDHPRWSECANLDFWGMSDGEILAFLDRIR